MWFDELTGFSESAAKIYAHFSAKDGQLQNNLTGISLSCGQLTTPSLNELRYSVASLPAITLGKLSVTERVVDVQTLHRDPTNAGALFQVASQFNLLERFLMRLAQSRALAIINTTAHKAPLAQLPVVPALFIATILLRLQAKDK